MRGREREKREGPHSAAVRGDCISKNYIYIIESVNALRKYLHESRSLLLVAKDVARISSYFGLFVCLLLSLLEDLAVAYNDDELKHFSAPLSNRQFNLASPKAKRLKRDR